MNQETEVDIQVIEQKIMDLLWSLRHALPQADIKDIQTLLGQNDFSPAVETLICILCEDEIPVPSEDIHKLQWLTKILKLSDAINMVKNIRVEFS
jgi:hypothetical protein